ncbi:hypothetical protein CL617_00690 [archaeon]|nr:hypothetical protein [archaeon]|tara:strand:- start:460 stop:753 length:294 start_codon:yes stop_codon:yes gene_type:complete
MTNKELIVKGDEVSEPYVETLEKVIDIRKDRRRIYKDEYINDSIDFLILIIENKMKRIRQTINDDKIVNDIEKCEDSILDAINYLIFLNCVINKNEN